MPLDRVGDWERFSDQVKRHIEQYAIPQYESKDGEDDQVNAWTAEECVTAIRRYVNRFGKNLRGPVEALRDLLKVAHYAQLGYEKLRIELDEAEIY